MKIKGLYIINISPEVYRHLKKAYTLEMVSFIFDKEGFWNDNEKVISKKTVKVRLIY